MFPGTWQSDYLQKEAFCPVRREKSGPLNARLFIGSFLFTVPFLFCVFDFCRCAKAFNLSPSLHVLRMWAVRDPLKKVNR
jgi:hypothetical protein